MSRFHRSGHWRTNSNGTTYWVSGHTVDRDDWGGYGYYSPPPAPPPTPSSRAPTSSPSAPDGRRASFTIPNATCPVCGASVFFYQNESGSRVFFDDLGPPWPKHPCTDNEPDCSARLYRPTNSAAPIMRVAGAASATNAVVPPKDGGNVEDGYSPPLRTGDGWDRCMVKKRSDHDGTAYFVALNASDPTNRSIRFSTPFRADLLVKDDTLYLSGDRMSFFSFDEFAPQEVSIEYKPTKAVSSSKKRAAKRRRARKRRK